MKAFSMKLIAAAAATFALTASAQAGTIGVWGAPIDFNGLKNGMSQFGHTVVSLNELSESSLQNMSAVFLIRTNDTNLALDNYIHAGGKVITEWSAASYGMGLLGGSAQDNYNTQSVSNIVFTAQGTLAGLGAGLGTSYTDDNATQYFQDIVLGNGTVYATRDGGQAAIIGGKVGQGFAWINAYDWQDWPSAPTFQLLANQIAYQVESNDVPEPASLALLGLGICGIAAVRRRTASSRTQ